MRGSKEKKNYLVYKSTDSYLYGDNDVILLSRATADTKKTPKTHPYEGCPFGLGG